MNRFAKTVSIFMLPIFIMGIFVEFSLRIIPNDYLYKKKYLDKNSENIEVLFLGSSHAYYGINPIYIHENSFNASYISQTLDYDYRIIEKYEGRWERLRYIVIPISYFSLFSKLGETSEAWRIKNYNIYFGLKSSLDISDYFEVLSNKPEINIKRIESFYLLGEENITTSELGWGTNFNSQNGFNDDGEVAAKRHTKNLDGSFFKENINTLQALIKYAGKKGVKIIFYTPPAFHTYVENLDRKKIDQTINTMTQLDEYYQNVVYINFLADDLFTETDFYNADHLNEFGAEKLTRRIGDLLIDSR
ncbi:MAG: hypothetical protein HY863_16620 [Chloroflexi bacterium]|nr:hypothetical protein [Chloroflexota bacterium]